MYFKSFLLQFNKFYSYKCNFFQKKECFNIKTLFLHTICNMQMSFCLLLRRCVVD